MYKVLIADDEDSVRESLLLLIPWEEFGLVVAGCAATGKEAVQIAEQENIDIAILDIRMPGMNGLEVCSVLKKNRSNMQLIIISGYAEFSYAERAMEFGVLGYCLKPLDYEKVKKLLVKAIGVLDCGVEHAKISNLADAIEKSDTKQLEEIFNKIQLDTGRVYVCVSIGEFPCEFTGKGITFPMGRKFYVSLTERCISEEEMRRGIEKGLLGIGYERKPVAVNELKDVLQTCKIRAYQFFIEEKPFICAEEKGDMPLNILNEIEGKLVRKNWQELYKTLDELKQQKEKNYDIRFCVRLINRIFTNDAFSEVESDYYIYDVSQLVSEYGSFSNMLNNLEQIILSIEDTKSTIKCSNTSFMKLLTWIQNNYTSDISLTQAAREMHMNPNYVSRMFKKEAGTTFVHYVTQLRMEEAARLLTTTNKSVVDISIAVGFSDYFYFLKLFKKYSNKTPSQYREE